MMKNRKPAVEKRQEIRMGQSANSVGGNSCEGIPYTPSPPKSSSDQSDFSHSSIKSAFVDGTEAAHPNSNWNNYYVNWHAYNQGNPQQEQQTRENRWTNMGKRPRPSTHPENGNDWNAQPSHPCAAEEVRAGVSYPGIPNPGQEPAYRVQAGWQQHSDIQAPQFHSAGDIGTGVPPYQWNPTYETAQPNYTYFGHFQQQNQQQQQQQLQHQTQQQHLQQEEQQPHMQHQQQHIQHQQQHLQQQHLQHQQQPQQNSQQSSQFVGQEGVLNPGSLGNHAQPDWEKRFAVLEEEVRNLWRTNHLFAIAYCDLVYNRNIIRAAVEQQQRSQQ